MPCIAHTSHRIAAQRENIRPLYVLFAAICESTGLSTEANLLRGMRFLRRWMLRARLTARPATRMARATLASVARYMRVPSDRPQLMIAQAEALSKQVPLMSRVLP